jgi:hypothetical protein
MTFMRVRKHDSNVMTQAPAFSAGGRLVVPRALAS